MSEFPKITPSHLARDAYVYVRQSSPTQVREHTESLERQYELRERAAVMGWAAHQIVVVDSDLGRSGAHTAGREGFKELVADVGLGKAGIILGIEVSRLARNNADWYHLLDLCALTDTLIADADGVYHPADYNDRLVLGLKGTMSEAELHLIRSRLVQGLRHKAAKGELRQRLPVGFDYDETGRVVMTPDEAVREAIATVFRRFEELGSARQVLLAVREDGLLLPRRRPGSARVRWVPATYAAVHDFLTTPTYAGAFVFGRTRREKRVTAGGGVQVHARQVPRSEWSVLIPDHHPGFVSWERFEQIQQELRANWRAPRGQSGGAVREGTALLQGRIRCGRCGRMMQTSYSGTRGNSPRYVCSRANQLYASGHACQSLGGRLLEQRVLEEMFAMLEPAALAATAKALNEAEAQHTARLRSFKLAVERARYEAERARRQFDDVEPENRLVARTLERTWEQRLQEMRRAEADLRAQRARRPQTLTDEELAWLERAGADVRAVFFAPSTTHRERKQLVRALIAEVVVTVNKEERTADLRVIWEGGACTDLTMALRKTGVHFRTTDEDTISLIRRLAQHYDDTRIAVILSRQRRRTATGLPFTKTRVKSLRAWRGIPAFTGKRVPVGGEDPQSMVSVAEASRELGVSKDTVYRWLRDGFVVGHQLTAGSPWHIRLDDELRERVVPKAPDGWLRLREAARVLGVAPQTVLHKVQRGELRAVHVNRGRRKGLRIQVNQDGAGLFATPE